MVEGLEMRAFIITIFVFATLFIAGCIDPITFDTGSEPRRLVVEGLITNQSYVDRLSLPAPAERFYVALRWTSEVGNETDAVISDARVELHGSDGSFHEYFWSGFDQRYIHPDDGFRALPDVRYFVRVILSSGEVYESGEEFLHPAPPISRLESRLDSRLEEIQVGDETQFINQRGVVLSVALPGHSNDDPYYYRWRIIPSWVYESSLLQTGNPNKTCFVTNRFYFQKINTRADRSGGYDYDLFFLETDDNEVIKIDFTAFIIQYSLSPEGYRFWNELALQQQSGGGIFDPPPFPLFTNIRNVNNPEERVSGFFSVANESVTRWYFNQDELPYDLTFADPCEPIPGIPFLPPQGCLNCLDYPGGNSAITNEKPEWWREY